MGGLITTNTRACVLLRRYLVMFFLVLHEGRSLAARGVGLGNVFGFRGKWGFGDEDDPEDDQLVGPEVIVDRS
jgi:hypothetical protein